MSQDRLFCAAGVLFDQALRAPAQPEPAPPAPDPEPRPLERYLVFAYDRHYPAGGWGDFQGSFPDLESARACGEGAGYDYYEIIDRETGQDLT